MVEARGWAREGKQGTCPKKESHLGRAIGSPLPSNHE